MKFLRLLVMTMILTHIASMFSASYLLNTAELIRLIIASIFICTGTVLILDNLGVWKIIITYIEWRYCHASN